MSIERHVPSICGPLPFIDHDAQMQMRDIVEVNVEIEADPYVEINPRTSDMDSWKSKIQISKEAVMDITTIM